MGCVIEVRHHEFFSAVSWADLLRHDSFYIPLQMRSQLSRFSVRNTACYNPNEQAKVMAVIRVCGAKAFNRYIQRLANANAFSEATDKKQDAKSTRYVNPVAELAAGEGGVEMQPVASADAAAAGTWPSAVPSFLRHSPKLRGRRGLSPTLRGRSLRSSRSSRRNN